MDIKDEEFSPPNAAELEGEASALGLAAQSSDVSEASGGWSVLAKQSDALMQMDGVVMVGLGSTEIGDQAIVVGVKRQDQLASLPSEIDGMPVRGRVIGEVDALGSEGKKGKR